MYETALHFCIDLAGNGGRARMVEGKLQVEAPDGFMTAGRVAYVKANKPAIAAVIEDEEAFALAAAVSIFDAESYFEVTRCPECGTEHNRETLCFTCHPKAWDLVLGKAPRLPARSKAGMVEELSSLTKEEREAYRQELMAAPASDPVHPLEELALEEAKRLAGED